MVIWFVSITIAVLLHGTRIVTLYENAGQDSFHTLDAHGQIGLVLISGLLALLALLLVSAVNRKFLTHWKGIKSDSVIALLIKLGVGLSLFAALIMVAVMLLTLFCSRRRRASIALRASILSAVTPRGRASNVSLAAA